MNAVTDFLGRPIHAGDTVVYAWRRGSMLGLKQLRVTQVLDAAIGGYASDGRSITLKNLKNVVVVELKEVD